MPSPSPCYAVLYPMTCLFDTQEVGLRLRRLDAPMCPRFHCDNLPVRLVTTYLGPGSEWLPEPAVNRAGLGAPTPDKSAIVSEEDAIRRLEAGDVALLKGSGWIGNEDHGQVHRSPDVPAGESRLPLTLDPGWLWALCPLVITKRGKKMAMNSLENQQWA